MNPIVRNALAVIAGIFVGSLVNMALIQIGPNIIPPPEGADMTTTEGVKTAMSMMTSKHFIFPFLAHALGTLVGAYATARIARTNHKKLALIVGGVFLLGGISMVVFVGSPLWFNALDLVAAYIPMAWLGGNWAVKRN
jgi:hypothetical protein